MRYPVSFAQQRLWFLEQLTPGLPTYHMPYATWLSGSLDADALQRALDAVVARHAVLRTSLVATNGTPEQIVADFGGIPLERGVVPEGITEADATRHAEAMAREAANRPFDLTRGPLARVLLIKAGPDRHLFAVTCHHSISDGWSMRILADEVAAGYRAAVTGEPSDLEPLSLQYGDYAVWQHDRLRGEELERQLSFWAEHLDGAPDVLALPTDHPRPAMLSYQGDLRSLTLPEDTVRRLGDLAQRHNATMFMVMLAAYQVVLSRYSRQDDIVVGTPVAGRTHTELNPMIGLFTNTLALRTSLAGDPRFLDVLRRVRDTTVDALSHQELPFEKLVEALAPERSLAHAPLCQVQFVYQPAGPPALDLPGITAETQTLYTATAKLDITLYAEGRESGDMFLGLEYSSDLFEPTWADRFLGCLVSVLEHIAESPETRIADLPLLSEEARRALAVGFNEAARGAPDHDHSEVPAKLLASPSMVSGADGEYPMSEVCEHAAQIARVLVDLGVGPDTPVGLYLDRGVGMLAGLLAVWWSGGAYVPMDPGFPPARLAGMAADAGVRVIVAHASRRDEARRLVDGAEVVCLNDPAVVSAAPLVPVSVPGNALAYTIFTSGSTGRPKGVSIDRAAVANLLGSFARQLPLDHTDTFVAVTTLSFDIALLELLLPLMVGARLVIADATQSREPDALRALLDRVGATATQATPQTWRLLGASGGVPASLRLRLCGGEALPRDLADDLTTPRSVLWNVYGPTETTVWSASGIVHSGPGPVEVGPPIDHTRVYVLDELLSPVPMGVIGEVYLAGRGVARGYHGAPRLTAARFVPEPWAAEPGSRMYRTGDLGRRHDGGGLELVGRTDHQVKIRGFRIECGEIEAALRSHPDIRQSAVVAATRGGESHLVAYVVPRRGSAAAREGADLAETLRGHLRETLPEYMLPVLVMALPSLPLTANAKVDRAALPLPDWAAVVVGDRVGPRDPIESALAEIWADLLTLSTPIGVHDNLFALGGHSLTATRLVSRMWEAFGVDVPVHRVFSGPTIAELATAVVEDPEFGVPAPSGPKVDLDALGDLSDDELDELVRAALTQRSRRRIGAAGSGATESSTA